MVSSRRSLMRAILGGSVVAVGSSRLLSANSQAQLLTDDELVDRAAQAGPLGLVNKKAGAVPELPVYIDIPDAEVSCEIEINQITSDGRMLDPTGAWIVSWYEGTGLLHEENRNLLMSGHVDYWGVGPSVFRNVANLTEGDEVTITGAQGGHAVYAVEWVERIDVYTITVDELQSFTGPTDYQALTLITCGGEFDGQEYLQRDLIRCRLVDNQEGDPEAPATPVAEVTGTPPDARPDGQPSVIVNGPVNMRPDASTSGDPVAVLEVDTVVTITGEPVEAEGYTWYPIRLEDGTEGWVVSEYLDIPD